MKTISIVIISAGLIGASLSAQAESSNKNSDIGIRLWRVERMLEQQNEILFKHIKTLQDELLQLRKMQEEQQYAITKLNPKKHRNYTAKKSRAPQKTITLNSPTHQKIQSFTTNPRITLEPITTNHKTETQAYQAAYDFIRKKKFTQAISTFNEYLKKYPTGKYTANAYYWLGEIYLLEDQLPSAEQAFNTVVEKFPKHDKAADALFKIATVYVKQQNVNKARNTFRAVQEKYPQSTAANLANNRLDTL